MLVDILSKFISHLKNEDFKLDREIPITYLLRLIMSKSIYLLYGQLRLCTSKKVFIHPTATIKCCSKIKTGNNFSVARECYLDALSVDGFICGNNVSLGYQTHIELTGSLKHLGKGIKIGNNVGLGTHGHYGSGMGFLEIGNDTIFGNYVSIHPENHNYNDKTKPIRLQGVHGYGVKIGNNCWIGAKVTILDNTIIGDNCIIAAGAVVKGTFPDNVVIGGIPAKIIKHI